MRVATYAAQLGAVRAFAREAFALAFVEGRDLAIAEHVLEAAHRAGLDRAATEAAATTPAVKDALRSATDAAFERGVFGVPTFAVGHELFWGDDRLEDAAAALVSARG